MNELKISPEANNDLVEIKNYISNKLHSPQAAMNLVIKIVKRVRELMEYPGIGMSLSSVTNIQTDYRFLVCDNYLIFYRQDDEAVFVIRILYSKRDYLRVLFTDIPWEEE